MDTQQLEIIKRLAIVALVSDDQLMGIIVLKGGNALNIAYDISNRGSVDIDFSIESDFSEKEKMRLPVLAIYMACQGCLMLPAKK